MKIHLKFLPGDQTKFIENILNESGLSIEQISNIVSVSSRNFRDWKREKITISKEAAVYLSERYNIKFPEKIEDLEKRWHVFFSLKSKPAGLAYKAKYGNPGTEFGRIKGGQKTLKLLRQKGIIPQIVYFRKPRKSKKLAELVGILLGDGSIGKLQVSITLNSIMDLDYSNYVRKLCNSIFNKNPKVRKRNNANALDIYYNGENLTKRLIDLGMVIGNKVKKQVDVPNWVKQDRKYSLMCLRGLMDTDGGVFIHQYKVNGKIYNYKKICFTNHSIPLLDFVYQTLKSNNLHPKIIKQKNMVNKKVWLYNSHEIDKYFDLVGSSNQRLNKYGGVA